MGVWAKVKAAAGLHSERRNLKFNFLREQFNA